MSDLPRMAPEMFAGLPGEVLDVYGDHTEAGHAAIIAHFIVGIGCAVGTGPHFMVGQTAHYLNENALIVGATGHARKGDSYHTGLSPLKHADPDFHRNIASGLSTGEGLIYHLRDPVEKLARGGQHGGEATIADPGVSDKRLFVVETEFVNLLKVMARDGNTLSNVVRDAWDHKAVLRTLTRNSPLRATGAHVAIIGHTTPEDLNLYLADVDAANGFANRFLFVATDRARLLPSPGSPPQHRIDQLADRVREVLDFGRRVGEMRRTAAGERLWHEVYPHLTADEPGLIGKLLARGEAHVARLSALYALFFLKGEVDVPHLRSALAFWDYSVGSTRRIFQGRTGNDTADKITQDLLPGIKMTLTQIREEIFSNHITARRLNEALKLLRSLGEITVSKAETGGRPVIVVTRLRSTESLRKKSAESVERSEAVG